LNTNVIGLHHMANIFIILLVNTLAFMLIAYMLPDVSVKNVLTAFITAVVFGLVNIFIRPILAIFTFTLTVLTFGFFIFVTNAIMVLITSAIVPGFKVKGFVPALLCGIILMVINGVLYYVIS
jgi:putative membrane protein